ncbi:DUF4138 domain-containing protein [Flagellimonas onchidii]|uniref:DUF4138 domain-containing protein n=1 Tax=Flagellimonas onchidii TaxID=2562684 RepID=UPI0010A618D9|nr:DUF4138 domain-containing protein [Allomuricauda onchidii]
MKKKLIIVCLGLVFSAHAKKNEQLDTIYANERMTMALFFPSNIKQGLTGSDNFVFTYNREKQQNLGLLKAIKGTDSNLLVITTDGKVYSYILKYSENLKNPNRFIHQDESIGTTKRKEVIKNNVSKNSISVDDSLDQLHSSCESLLNLPEKLNKRKIEGNVKLSVKNQYYHGDNVYIQFEIENKSEIRFNFDYLNIYKVSGNNIRNASYQEIPMKPIYIHNVQDQILPNTKARFVYVVPKFAIDKNEKIMARLQEQNTVRSVNLVWK